MPAWTSLLDAWERSPEPGTAIALCHALRESADARVVSELGRRVAKQHSGEPEVLLAAGRAFLGARRLGDAQSVLVAAGKIRPKDAEVYRWLGEVLLRRGDAARAAKVFDRAVALGRSEEDTAELRELAIVYVGLQKRSGPKAVAAEVARQAPEQPHRSEQPAGGCVAGYPRPRRSDSEHRAGGSEQGSYAAVGEGAGYRRKPGAETDSDSDVTVVRPEFVLDADELELEPDPDDDGDIFLEPDNDFDEPAAQAKAPGGETAGWRFGGGPLPDAQAPRTGRTITLRPGPFSNPTPIPPPPALPGQP